MINKKNLIKIIVVLILFLSPLFMTIGANDVLVPTGISNNGLVGADLLTLLLEVKSIELDSDVFNNEVFVNLKDFSKEIQPQSVGRKNPFSVIGSD